MVHTEQAQTGKLTQTGLAGKPSNKSPFGVKFFLEQREEPRQVRHHQRLLLRRQLLLLGLELGQDGPTHRLQQESKRVKIQPGRWSRVRINPSTDNDL